MLERLHENISNDPNIEPYVLWRLKDDSTKTQGQPGLPVNLLIIPIGDTNVCLLFR